MVPATIAKAIAEARWELEEHLYLGRTERGLTWRELAERVGVDPATARRYARRYELTAADLSYEWDDEPPASCNALPLRCSVCGHGFTASRADARYCSNACRQDAYRKRKLNGAIPADPGCPDLPGEECRWASSCSRDGCWRRECAESGRPLFGTRTDA